MDDERLLSEALRAHAAGGVSTPRAVPPSEPPTATPATDAPADRPRRFRPLGRRKTADPGPTTGERTVRADVPAPRSGSLAPPPPGVPLGVRPAPPRPVPPYGGPRQGPPAAHGPYPSGPPVPPRAVTPAQGPGTWNASTVAWWGAVSLLAGGTVGAAIGVLSLLLPA
ncbi:hypothetical protein [Actinomycetospora sp. NBRC 106378]|uniref:hypothetical protein n=1 Tax=Actinomycetospora sp. NBRC 106378 TaxID=3032208 RepID=UPI0024A28CEC|nr:hypothetical protein [Actinomycetospora sp. NBRC 106378]GLZ51166.1 hypothetical protein Acsp07_07830 [Actinomycetospora sp. NBRC 106378]